jgi:alpha-galactosidase/6-phospho-beta-glucosidase family protein
MNVAGVCELPWTTLLDTCRAADTNPRDVSFDYFGLNHLGWLYGIHHNGRTIAPSVPLKYLRLHEERRAVVMEQRESARPRGADLEETSRKAFQIYSYAEKDEIHRTLQLRSTPWYRHAIGPLIAALAGVEVHTSFFLSSRNASFDPAYRNDDVLEYAWGTNKGTIQRKPRINPVPAHMRHTLEPFIEYERIAVGAVRGTHTDSVEEALGVHPWIDATINIKQMAREILKHAHAA